MTIRQKVEIRRIGKKQAESIRGGLLGQDIIPSYPIAKVHQSAWEPLALMNEHGFITINSQDAIDDITGKVKNYERSYVIGYMLSSEADEFVERFNLWTDGMAAFASLRIPEREANKLVRQPANSVPVSIKFNPENSGWIRGMSLRTFVPDFWDDQLRRELGFSKRMPLTIINVFDTTWGRPARDKKNGLFNAIFKTFDSTIIRSKNIRNLPPPPRPFTEEEKEQLKEYWSKRKATFLS